MQVIPSLNTKEKPQLWFVERPTPTLEATPERRQPKLSFFCEIFDTFHCKPCECKLNSGGIYQLSVWVYERLDRRVSSANIWNVAVATKLVSCSRLNVLNIHRASYHSAYSRTKCIRVRLARYCVTIDSYPKHVIVFHFVQQLQQTKNTQTVGWNDGKRYRR